MDYIDTIYGQLSSLNLAASKTEYSRRWLGMEGSYYRNKLSKRLNLENTRKSMAYL